MITETVHNSSHRPPLIKLKVYVVNLSPVAASSSCISSQKRWRVLPAPHVEWVAGIAVKRLAAGGILYFTQRELKEDGALSLICQVYFV